MSNKLEHYIYTGDSAGFWCGHQGEAHIVRPGYRTPAGADQYISTHEPPNDRAYVAVPNLDNSDILDIWCCPRVKEGAMSNETAAPKQCPDCGHDLTDPAPAGEAGDDSYYCEGCGKAWSLDSVNLRCLDQSADCAGAVELRPPMSSTGRWFPRCDHHIAIRLKEQDRIRDRYPDSPIPPSDFDPSYAGESWDEDN